MKPEFSQAIIKKINEDCSTAIFACYEQIYPNDSFGRVMIQNLEVKSQFFFFDYFNNFFQRGEDVLCKELMLFQMKMLKKIVFLKQVGKEQNVTI